MPWPFSTFLPLVRRPSLLTVKSYLILLSRQGKVVCTVQLEGVACSRLIFTQRLAKWFTTLSPKDKAKIVKDVTQLVLARRTRMCNFLEYKGVCCPPKYFTLRSCTCQKPSPALLTNRPTHTRLDNFLFFRLHFTPFHAHEYWLSVSDIL